ncbi:MAG: SDR family oxidoreductase [Thermoanaerobaculia bacterium]
MWQEKVVWITGASSGIGEAVAREVGRRGARLVLSARRRERLEALRREIGESERHAVVPLDLADTAAIPAVVEAALAHAGHIDVMVHNAGISQRALVIDTALAVDRHLLEVNFFGTVALTKALLPAMLEAGGGRFVVVTSLVGKIGTPLRSGYAASKHALHGFFDSLRAELWERGIRVTLVCPGFIKTELPLAALTGDGSPQGKMDRAQLAGYPADRCAEKIVTAVERDREEVLIGGKEKHAVYLKRFLPRLFSRLIRRARVT